MTAPGPLPVPSEGREHRIHAGCGGSGCPGCRHTGYATMGPVAIARVAARVGPGEAPGVGPPPPSPAQLSLMFD
ncbi:hypothetical protein [Tautonia plasticadhaerens]|uniref:Uncharacterized protein n=1 Tax=Tautonia plasticadhaerens TaxID=2527974 RepID=A0A518GZI9_9BACT|nr:hypothetical protein [Tautonia plasticadhaerens]QDV34006.1 hypothetical protein ElP_18870 [Tautonia plasticadhaerens]